MQETELFALLEGAGDAAWVVTVDGEILAWNAVAERLLGLARSDVLGQRIDRVLDARDALGTAALAGGPEAATRAVDAPEPIPAFDLEVRTGSGERIWVNVSTIVVTRPRTGRRLLVRLARDVTVRKREEELLRRAVELGRELVALSDESAGHAPVEPLSAQERRVLTLLARGRSAAATARTLRISPHTLRNHLHHINRKLRTHSRLEAVTHALRRGLIE